MADRQEFWDRRSLLKAVKRNGWELEHAPPELQDDEEIVMAACRSAGGGALRFASPALQNNREIVMVACSKHPFNALRFASELLQDDEKVVLHALTKPRSELAGFSLQFASSRLRATKRIVLVACQKNGLALQFASPDLTMDSEVILAACKSNGLAIQYASPELRASKEVALVAIRQNSLSLEYVSTELKDDRGLVVEACCHRKRNGLAIQFASDRLRTDKELIMKVCSHQGLALQHAHESLRQDIDVVLAAVYQNKKYNKEGEKGCPEALKYALGGLNQDQTCLVAAGIWDNGYKEDQFMLPDTMYTTGDVHVVAATQRTLQEDAATTRSRRANRKYARRWAKRQQQAHKKPGVKIVLSTRFSLDAQSTSIATQFTVELKKHPYIKDFVVYSPNAFNKHTCDPEWTNRDWPCRGTTHTCQMEDPSLRTGPPQDGCCWRYSFRHQLEEARLRAGFMLQLVEYDESRRDHVLGNGQQIESEMAEDTQTKVFRIFQPGIYQSAKWGVCGEFGHNDIDKIVSCIQDWYGGAVVDDNDIKVLHDMSVCEIHFEGSDRTRNRHTTNADNSNKSKTKSKKHANKESKQRRKKWASQRLDGSWMVG